MGLVRAALIFGVGYAVGDANRRRQLVSKANDLAQRPEVQRLQDRGRTAIARVTRRSPSEGGQEAGAAGTNGAVGGLRRWRPLPYRRSAAASASPAVKDAGTAPLAAESAGARVVPDSSTPPAPDSPEFLERQNPVEKVSGDTTADAPATETGLIGTDPSRTENGPST
jgi:hypothetical protein